MNRSKAAVWIGVSGVALLAAAPALGAGFTIGGGTTVTATQTLVSSETGVIAAGGKIDTSGTSGPGVSGQNANTVTNQGEVTAKSDGIVLLDGNQVTNSGVIASGTVRLSGVDGYDGIQAGDNNIIVNKGSITGIDDGIDVRNGNTITNSGSIIGSDTTSWDGVWGIIAGDNNKIYNEAGATITSGQSEVQLGSNNYVRNSGSIGDSSFGWSIQGANSNTIVVTSTGTVTGKIYLNDNNKIINHGSIGSLGMTNSNRLYNYGTLNFVEVHVGAGNYVKNTGTLGPYGINILGSPGIDTTIVNSGTIASFFQGIYVRDGGTLILLGSTGRIEADLEGIKAYDSRETPLVISTANAIFSKEDGIYAVTEPSSYGKSAAITITATGNIDSVNSRGIYTKTTAAEAGVLSVTSAGAVTAKKEGIYAYSAAGAVSLSAGGAVSSQTRAAIMAAGGGNVTVTGAAAIAASSTTNSDAHGIDARASGAGTVTVDVSGNIASANARGISAASASGAVSVTTRGTVSGLSNGISARTQGAGDATIDVVKGSVTSSGETGVFAQAAGAGNAAVTVAGGAVISADNAANSGAHGIYAVANSGAASVVSSGNTASKGGSGIFATSTSGAVSVTSAGTVSGKAIGVAAFSSTAKLVSVDVTKGSVTGSLAGVYAVNLGSGGVTVNNSGSITAGQGDAILVGGKGNLAVSVSGTVTGAGVAGAAGVQFGSDAMAPGATGVAAAPSFDGAANTLTVASGGVVNNAGGLSQLAVLGFSGNEAISNSGTVSGNVNLGTGANSFANQAGGVFNMGTAINLGAGNVLSNAGTLSPGGNGAVATVAVTGNLTQSGGGTWVVDVNPSTGAADRINLSGSASLSGTVAINSLNPVAANQQFTILSAAGGVTGNGLVLVEDQSTVARTLALTYPSPNDVVLSVRVDFAAEGLNPNQARLGGNLNSLYGNAGGMAPLLGAMLQIGDLAAYEDALNQLSPEAYLQAAMSGVFGAQAFADGLMTCREREGTHAYIAQGQCLWMVAGGGNFSRDQTGDQLGSDQTSWWLGGGGQFAVSDTVQVGLGVRYEHVSQDVGDDASNDGAWGHIGAAVKYTPGPWLLGASLSGGKGGIDTDRNIGIGTVSGKAEGDQDLSYVHGKLRAAYLFDMGQWYAKPILDLDATWMSYGDVSEDGGGGAGLDIGGSSQTVLSATPRLEIGAQLEIKNGTLVRPYLQAGVAFYGDTGFSVDSAFLDAPGGSPTFVTETEMDSVLADISVGLDVLAVENLNVRLSYDGLFGSNTTSNAGTLRLEWRL